MKHGSKVVPQPTHKVCWPHLFLRWLVDL